MEDSNDSFPHQNSVDVASADKPVTHDVSGESAADGSAVGGRIGTYEIREILGRGGMAEVYKAYHVYLHRLEAIKVLLPHAAHDQAFVQRFLREARTAANLHHPHIATIFTVSVPETPQPYFTMELLEGGDLATLLEREGQMPLDETITILRQVASALDYAHAHNVIHRDIKPANILLRSGEGARFVKVVDFGIARAQEEIDGARLTKSGLIVGTPEYMSPEQAGSGPKVDRRTDIYSLGVVAYEMFCGQLPFEAGEDDTTLMLIMKHVRDNVRPPQELRPDLSPRINNAILKALSKTPEERFASCGDFVNALGRGSASGVFTSPFKQAPKPAKKRAAVAVVSASTVSDRKTPHAWPLAAAIAAVLVMTLAGWAFTQSRIASPPVKSLPLATPTATATPVVTPTTPAITSTATPSASITPKAAIGLKPTPKAVATLKVTPKVAATPAKKTIVKTLPSKTAAKAPVRTSSSTRRRAPQRSRIVREAAPRIVRPRVRRTPIRRSQVKSLVRRTTPTRRIRQRVIPRRAMRRLAPRRITPRRSAPRSSTPRRSAPALPF